VKTSKGAPLRISKVPQKIIIDLTGDVNPYINLIYPRLIILLQEPEHEPFDAFSVPRVSI
jgi:hypothetical protein